jgi:hypothetical protein
MARSSAKIKFPKNADGSGINTNPGSVFRTTGEIQMARKQ